MSQSHTLVTKDLDAANLPPPKKMYLNDLELQYNI